jgi:hypothetical protein
MGRKLIAATAQMDVTMAPVPDRLRRAADLTARAARAGAQFVALPELFNTGYGYDDGNYALAEPLDGQTVTWMKTQAAQHAIHLVGSLMLLDGTDIYNAALLVAPDGRLWRHDKINVLIWEWAYCRPGHQVTIADTDLGKLGLMICADTLRPELWAQYAGKVDAMVLMFSPGDFDNAYLIFPDGLRVNYAEFEKEIVASPDGDAGDLDGYDAGSAYGDEYDGYGAHFLWMNVPMICASQAGVLRTRLPRLELLLQRSHLADRASQAPDVWFEMQLPLATGIGAEGETLAQGTTAGDGVVWAEIELADAPPQPQGPQPHLHVDEDYVAELVKPLYKEGIRRHWGAHMAPD